MTKHFFLLFFLLSIVGFSCKKKVVNKALTKTEMVARTWICDEAYIIGNNRNLAYRKGQAGNSISLENSFITFYKEGKYEGIDFNNIPKTGTWKFSNNETVTTLQEWEYPFEIVELTADKLLFKTKLSYAGRVFEIEARMIPKTI